VKTSELVGGALFNCPDLDSASDALLAALLDPKFSEARLLELKIPPPLVKTLRRHLTGDADELRLACNAGASWVEGYRARVDSPAWDLVLSAPTSTRLPKGVRRTTGETLAALMSSASTRIAMVAPFFDATGASYLGESIAAATARGVDVVLYLPQDVARKKAALEALGQAVRRGGDLRRLTVLPADEPAPWPHLKVLVADGRAAYIGSANLTGPALGGNNLELGVVVRGPQVEAIDRVLALIPTKERLPLQNLDDA
jgi:phosphatidylserine/phosphatidylglycerophosphate/cardiolipin synthase-like enzyme